MIKRALILRRHIQYSVQNSFLTKDAIKSRVKFADVRQLMKAVMQNSNKYEKNSTYYISLLESLINFVNNDLKLLLQYEKEIEIILKELTKNLLAMNVQEIILVLQAFGNRDKGFRIKKQLLIEFHDIVESRISNIINEKSQLAPNIQDLQQLIRYLLPLKKAIRISYFLLQYMVSLNPSKEQFVRILNIFEIYALSSMFEMRVQVVKFIIEQYEAQKLPQSAFIANVFISYTPDWSMSVNWFVRYFQNTVKKAINNEIQDWEELAITLNCLLRIKICDYSSESTLYLASNKNILKIYNHLVGNLDDKNLKQICLLTTLILKNPILDPTAVWENIIQKQLIVENMDQIDFATLNQAIFLVLKIMVVKPFLLELQYRKKLWKILFKFCILNHKKEKKVVYYIRILEHMILIITNENKNNFMKFLQELDRPDHRPFIIVRLQSIFSTLQLNSKHISKAYEQLRRTKPALVLQNLSRTNLKDRNFQQMMMVCRTIIKDQNSTIATKSDTALWRGIITTCRINKMLNFWSPYLLKLLTSDENNFLLIVNFLQAENYQITFNEVQLMAHIVILARPPFAFKEAENTIRFGRLEHAIEQIKDHTPISKMLLLLIFITKLEFSLSLDTRYSIYKYTLRLRIQNPHKQNLMTTINELVKKEINDKFISANYQYEFYPQLKDLILWVIQQNCQFQDSYVQWKLLELSENIIKEAETLSDRIQLIQWFDSIKRKHNAQSVNFTKDKLLNDIKYEVYENAIYEVVLKQNLNIKLQAKQIVTVLCKQALSLKNRKQLLELLIQSQANPSILELQLIVRAILKNNLTQTTIYEQFKVWIIPKLQERLMELKNSNLISYIQTILMLNIQLSSQNLKILSQKVISSKNQELLHQLVKLNLPQEVIVEYLANCLGQIQHKMLVSIYFKFFPDYAYYTFSVFLREIIIRENKTLLSIIIDILLKNIVQSDVIYGPIQLKDKDIFNDKFIFWLFLNTVKTHQVKATKILKVLGKLITEQHIDNFIRKVQLKQQAMNLPKNTKKQEYQFFKKIITLYKTQNGQFAILIGDHYSFDEKRILSVLLKNLMIKNQAI